MASLPMAPRLLAARAPASARAGHQRLVAAAVNIYICFFDLYLPWFRTAAGRLSDIMISLCLQDTTTLSIGFRRWRHPPPWVQSSLD